MSLSFAFESQDFCCAENLIFLAVTSAFRLDNLEIDRINTALSARARYREATSYLLFFLQVLPGESTARKASFGMLMGPAWTARRFLPSFCFSSSFFLRVMSPP
jgi:hypothetical protein